MAVGKGFGAAKAAVEEVQKSADVKYPRFALRIPDGETSVKKQVRFLDAENMLTIIEHWTEYKNTWKRNYVCPNEGVIGSDKCITCRGKKSTDYVDDQRKHAHLIELINRESGAVEPWKFSPMVMATLLQKNEELGNITDRDFFIEFRQNTDENIKAKFIYVITEVTEEPTPLTKADKELVRYDLETLVPKYDEENLKRISEMLPGETGKKNGIKAATSASDFASQALKGGVGASKSLLDDFASLTKPKAAPKATATAEAEPEASASDMDEFNKLMNDM